MEASFYEYTKSAQEIKKFKCEENCREIAAQYERFNKENGVYEFFGEKLLEEAKENYGMEFESNHIRKYLTSKNVDAPASENIEYDREWYKNSEAIKNVCPPYYKFNRTDYFWYTIWRIAKEYNCKNGCVVTDTPKSYESYTDNYLILDWSEEARNYATGEKYKREARESWKLFPVATFGAIVGCLTPVAIWIIMFVVGIFCVENPIENANNWIDLRRTIPFCTIVFCLIFATGLRKVMISQDIEMDSVEFRTHCKNIEKTEPSSFDLENGKVKTNFY